MKGGKKRQAKDLRLREISLCPEARDLGDVKVFCFCSAGLLQLTA